VQRLQRFIGKQQEEKSFLPPIRVVVAGDDREFSSFLKSFVNINMNR
jgi:hypothetical protein